jgi:restriction system protein
LIKNNRTKGRCFLITTEQKFRDNQEGERKCFVKNAARRLRMMQRCAPIVVLYRGTQNFASIAVKPLTPTALFAPGAGSKSSSLSRNSPSQVVINNTNTNTVNASANANAGGGPMGRPKNKWVALCLCIFLGMLGAHKFYEGRVGMGILYLFTGGLFAIGIIIDVISILAKPNPYYVY